MYAHRPLPFTTTVQLDEAAGLAAALFKVFARTYLPLLLASVGQLDEARARLDFRLARVREVIRNALSGAFGLLSRLSEVESKVQN